MYGSSRGHSHQTTFETYPQSSVRCFPSTRPILVSWSRQALHLSRSIFHVIWSDALKIVSVIGLHLSKGQHFNAQLEFNRDRCTCVTTASLNNTSLGSHVISLNSEVSSYPMSLPMARFTGQGLYKRGNSLFPTIHCHYQWHEWLAKPQGLYRRINSIMDHLKQKVQGKVQELLQFLWSQISIIYIIFMYVFDFFGVEKKKL